MQNQLRALILEDSQSDTLLLLRQLRQSGYEVEYTRVDTSEEMIAALDEGTWDVILSDYSMPQFSATAGLKLVQKRGLDIPFIIVSGTMGEETAVAAMKAGAHDYFPKGKTTRLVAAIERELREAQERKKRRQVEEQLRRSEERFVKAFQGSPIGATISSNQGGFLSVNDSFCHMIGFEASEVIGRTALEMEIWNNTTDQKLLEVSQDSPELVRDKDLMITTRSGQIRDVSISTQRISINGDTCILAMWHDITDRKHAERTLQKNSELIQLIQDITIAANAAMEVDQVLQFAVDRICEYVGWPLGHVYVKSKRRQPQLISSRIWHIADLEQFQNFRDVSEQMYFDETTGGLVYQVFSTSTPRWAEEIANVDGYLRLDMAQDAGIETVCAFPISIQNEVVGVIEFFSTTTDEPDQAIFDTIPHIAAQIGQVVERTRANAEIQALYNATGYLFNAENLQELAQQIVQGVVQEFEHVDCGLLLINRQEKTLRRLARAGQYRVEAHQSLSIEGSGLVPQAIREKQILYLPVVEHDPHYVANSPSTRSEMVVPLRTAEEVIGVLDLQSTQSYYFNESDERILGAFAERAAAALEITRLYEEINQYAAQLELRVAERTAQLQKAKDRVEAILNNSSDAIILVNADGGIQQTNPRLVETCGYYTEELFDQKLADVLSTAAEDDLAQILAMVVEKREYRRLEAHVRRKDGTAFPADVVLAAFADNNDIEIVCSMRDISEQKQLEQELRAAFQRQKELTELKSRFVSVVSHEYRTPLAIIQTSCSLLMSYSDRLTEDRKQQHLGKITDNVKRLTTLLDEILEINRAETVGVDFSPEKIDVTEICREMVEDTRHVNPNHQVDFHVFGEVVSVVVDVKLVQRIVSNLLSNAIKYSPEQGVVQVTLQFLEQQFHLKVSDNGMGIPPEDLDKLFTLFHRARNVGQIQGTGLGLAIVKQAVDAHGGDISVESSVGNGTTFTVTFPI